jgi:minor curlin subunit
MNTIRAAQLVSLMCVLLLAATARAGDLAPSELDGPARAARAGRATAGMVAALVARQDQVTVAQDGTGNNAGVVQSGLDNEATIQQRGLQNDAGILQAGAGNRAAIEQQGVLNTARIEQYGQQGQARITQYGNGKTATIVQYKGR